MNNELWEKYLKCLTGENISAVWFGHGSTIFLEIGNLSKIEHRNKQFVNRVGRYSIMVEWSWRFESMNGVLCGSWSEKQFQKNVMKLAVGKKILDINLFSANPELSVSFDEGLFFSSFMTHEGGPRWVIFDNNTPSDIRSLSISGGKLVEQ